MIFPHFVLLLENVRNGKRKHFYGRPRAIATPLYKIMRWDITALVQSVNLICANKSNTPIGLNIFSLRQQQNHKQNF